MRNRRFLIYQLAPPDLAEGQIGKTRFQTNDLFFLIPELSTRSSSLEDTNQRYSGGKRD